MVRSVSRNNWVNQGAPKRFGTFFAQLDNKDRFSMPAAIRRTLSSPAVVLVPSKNKATKNKLLRIFTVEAWEKLIESLPADQRDIYINHSQPATIDKVGRVRIPKAIMKLLDFKSRIKLAIVRDDDHLRVWKRSDYNDLPLPTV